MLLQRLRIVMLCLLALALPVQGFAAATMLLCQGSTHHRAQAGSPRDQAHHHGHEVDSAQSHHHGQAGGAAKADGKCPSCSACCTAVALPTSVPVFAPLQTASPMEAVVAVSSAGFLTGGQDRPPRSLLA